MAGCKLTKSVRNDECKYDVAGVLLLYLTNWYPNVDVATPDDGSAPAAQEDRIVYAFNTDGVITHIVLPTGEKFYQIDGNKNTTSYADDLTENGNGGKFRTHTVNTVIGKNDMDVQIQGDAISLGKQVAIVVGKDKTVKVLGRENGLEATAFNYASGATSTDASGWTTTLVAEAGEMAPIVENLSVITPIENTVVVP